MDNNKKNQMPFEIDIDPEISNGQYSNTLIINHTVNEFVMDFAFVGPGYKRPKVLSRQIITPPQMVRMLNTLKESIQKYENMYGKINLNVNNKDKIIN